MDTASALTKEIRSLDSNVLIVLAGNKSDCPESQKVVKISQADRDLAKELGVSQNFKVSAKEGTNVFEMFEKIVRITGIV